MEIIIRPEADDAALMAAKILAKEIRVKPDLVIGLATGRTMESVYSYLIDFHKKEGLDFSRCTTFNLDEYIGLAADNKNSYRYYMNHHLFDHINIKQKSTHLPNGAAADPDKECELYEKKIKKAGGIDFQLLGVGRSGHIGFNEPLSALQSRTRCKSLTPTTINQNSPLFDNPAEMPRRAMTMGIGTILESRRCLLLATGKEKAEILAKAVEGPITSMISATALQLHPKCTVIVDEDAATNLQSREYYDWIFQNEPVWQEFH